MVLVRVRRVELRSPVWKTGIITAIRHPRITEVIIARVITP